jgi:tripartite-type tricarboxylate transporter receptor subunit TctC
MAESGVPGYEHEPWNAMFGPAGVPKAIVARIHAEVVRAVNAPDVKQLFERDGADVVASPPDVFARTLKAEIAKWSKVIRAAGVKLE